MAGMRAWNGGGVRLKAEVGKEKEGPQKSTEGLR